MLEKTSHGHIDALSEGVVSGWAAQMGAASGNGPASLFIFIDGTPVDNILCSIDRPDLISAGFPAAKAGFAYRIPARFWDGAAHRLAIKFASGEFLDFVEADGLVVQEFGFVLDAHEAVQGVVDGVRDGAIRGWAVRIDPETGRRIGGVDIVVTCNGATLGQVKAQSSRPDVAKAIDCDAYCGFAFVPPIPYRDGRAYEFHFHVPPRSIPLANSPFACDFPTQFVATRLAEIYTAIEDISVQTWQLRRKLRALLTRDCLTLDDYDAWARQYYTGLRRRVAASRSADAPAPLVSIICPVYRPRLSDFQAAVESVLAQTYANWELIIVDDRSGSRELSAVIEAFTARDRRIRAIVHRKNGGISAASNTAIKAAKGEFIALFDHDDVLVDVAVEVMVAAARRSGARMLYSDEDKIDDYGRFLEPNFKPDWNYRLLLSQNYVCHFLLVEAATLRKAGPFDAAYDGAQDHDLVLRLAEILPEEAIHHVSELLYHWRKTPGSTAADIGVKSYAVQAGIDAVQAHLKRRRMGGRVIAPIGMTTYAIDWRFKEEPKVCVVVPFKDQIELTQRCLDAVLGRTKYRNVEIILVDNWSVTEEAAGFRNAVRREPKVRVLRVEEAFNFSRLNNRATRETDAEFYVFMNNDVLVEQDGWLRILVDEALADAKVAAVGAKLVYPNRTVQHGGVVLGVGGVASHVHHGIAATATGWMGRAICAQELSAVTAALMLCRAEAFRAAGGFDEEELPVAYNDVDLCLRLRRLGYKVIWTPSVVAEHHELISRGDDMQASKLARFVHEEAVIRSRWAAEIADDPFYSRHFSREGGIFHWLAEDEPAIVDGIAGRVK